MGDLHGELRRRVSSKLTIMVSITIFLIGLERVHTVESVPGRGVPDSMAKATSSVFRPSSLGDIDLPQVLHTDSDEGSARGVVLPELAPLVGDELSRRELWSSFSYIGYGALFASHVPCTPRSGRSYYTPNCRSASGPVRSYYRGCSRISRCYRG